MRIGGSVLKRKHDISVILAITPSSEQREGVMLHCNKKKI